MYNTWQIGDRAKLAKLAGISPQYLCDLIHCRKRALPELATKLEDASGQLGYEFTRLDWLYPEESDNPLFL